MGKSSDIIGMFREGKCNASGNRLISFLTEVELVVCNEEVRQKYQEAKWEGLKKGYRHGIGGINRIGKIHAVKRE